MNICVRYEYGTAKRTIQKYTLRTVNTHLNVTEDRRFLELNQNSVVNYRHRKLVPYRTLITLPAKLTVERQNE